MLEKCAVGGVAVLLRRLHVWCVVSKLSELRQSNASLPFLIWRDTTPQLFPGNAGGNYDIHAIPKIKKAKDTAAQPLPGELSTGSALSSPGGHGISHDIPKSSKIQARASQARGRHGRRPVGGAAPRRPTRSARASRHLLHIKAYNNAAEVRMLIVFCS